MSPLKSLRHLTTGILSPIVIECFDRLGNYHLERAFHSVNCLPSQGRMNHSQLCLTRALWGDCKDVRMTKSSKYRDSNYRDFYLGIFKGPENCVRTILVRIKRFIHFILTKPLLFKFLNTIIFVENVDTDLKFTAADHHLNKLTCQNMFKANCNHYYSC